MAQRSDREHVAFSPREFAALFQKEQSWGYRQIYAGKVKTITEFGRILIPAAEIDRILATAGIYDGLKKKPPKTKAEFERLKPSMSGAWRAFVEAKKPTSRAVGGKGDKSIGEGKERPADAERRAVMARFTGRKSRS